MLAFLNPDQKHCSESLSERFGFPDLFNTCCRCNRFNRFVPKTELLTTEKFNLRNFNLFKLISDSAQMKRNQPRTVSCSKPHRKLKVPHSHLSF